MSRRDIIAVSDIEEMLKGRVKSLCRELFPNGVEQGNEFRVGSLQGEKGQSLAVHIGAARCGTWKDFSGGAVAGRDRGDLLWLIACAEFGGDIGKAIRWAKSWLHLDDLDPARLERFKVEAEQAARKRDEEAAAKVRRAQASARKRWHAGVPIGGTIVETYFLGRGIDLRPLGKAPGALRFHPEVQHGYGAEAIVMPAMLAQVTSLAGEHVATHRTWLKRDPSTGSGQAVRKAGPEDGIPKPKKVLGPFDGGHIPLWKGACGAMPLRDIPAGTDVYVSEGIEDGLTAACADPSLRIVAGISVGNIGALQLPRQMGWLVILAQNDPPGSDADKALGRAIAAQRARGHKVKVARPPRGHGAGGVKDINELAQRSLESEAA